MIALLWHDNIMQCHLTQRCPGAAEQAARWHGPRLPMALFLATLNASRCVALHLHYVHCYYTSVQRVCACVAGWIMHCSCQGPYIGDCTPLDAVFLCFAGGTSQLAVVRSEYALVSVCNSEFCTGDYRFLHRPRPRAGPRFW